MRIGIRTACLLAMTMAMNAATCAETYAATQAAAPAGPSAQALLDRMINVPAAGYSIEGSAVTGRPKLRDDPTVQGGKALRVVVAGRNAEPWAVNAIARITKPVKKGDALMLAFWARLVKGEGGATTAQVPTAAIQITAPPYASVVAAPATIGPEWKLHQVRGRADRDYAAGDLAVSIHLATGRQTIDLGPVFVLDLGPGGAS